VKTSEVVDAWWQILRGKRPALSVEITKECPLRCPGCYAYEDGHLGSAGNLRSLADFKGDELVRRVFELADRLKPLHISIVGGDPLVRYRELEIIVPGLLKRGIHVQVVTSAFRAIPQGWGASGVNVVVSIDGLQAEHDLRRAPATYERILKSISGGQVTIHCTITGQMMKRAGYLEEFLEYWTPREEIAKVWFSLFTPQVGDSLPEMLSAEERARALAEMSVLRRRFSKLDMPDALIREFGRPPRGPEECVFAQTTRTLSADLKTKIVPCQFGGRPDCASCGCVASMALAAVAAHRLGGIIPVGALFKASLRIGKMFAPVESGVENPLRVLG
jgi:MoaA/NifB/PqqE/SkfB family radical SAM enzyme